MKTCTRCKRTKVPDDFHRNSGVPSGRRSICKECSNGRVRRRGEPVTQEVDADGLRPPLVAKAELDKPGLDNPRPPSLDDDLANRRQRAEIADLKARLQRTLDALEQTRFELATATAANDARREVEPIVPRERTSMMREATFVALASDRHIESTVTSEQVNGVNEYNLEIAKRRVERYFGGAAYLARYHADHFAIRDGILWLGGDLITGYLHPDNVETNSLSPVQAIATLQGWLADGIRSMLEGTGVDTLRVICNSGNHGRITDKMRAASREASSIEWLLYHQLAREFADEPRVQFTLPAGSFTYVRVYGKTIRFSHGDDTKYGGGVGGIMIPIRKAIARWQTVRHADLNVIGHYHAYHDLPDLVVNGSLIGYDAYAMSIGAMYEEPQQGFFLMDSKRGKTMPASIWVKDSDEEQVA